MLSECYGQYCQMLFHDDVSSQDVVTRGGKLVYLYKRPGKRVIVNDSGQLMVGPSLIEATLQQNTAGDALLGCCLCCSCAVHVQASLASPLSCPAAYHACWILLAKHALVLKENPKVRRQVSSHELLDGQSSSGCSACTALTGSLQVCSVSHTSLGPSISCLVSVHLG